MKELMIRRWRKRNMQQKEEAAAEGKIGGRSMWKKRWKGAGERERKLIGRQCSVGTISADACSYAVRILLSRAEIPAGFLRSLSSRAAFAERCNGGRQRCRKKERDEKKEEGEEEEGAKKKGRRKEEDEESRTSPPRGMSLPRHSLGTGIMKSSSWGTSWLYFAGVRWRRRASCNGKILNSLATRRAASNRKAEVRGIARTFHSRTSAIEVF